MKEFENIVIKSLNFIYMTILILYTLFLCSCVIVPVLYFIVNIFCPITWSLAELYKHLPQGFSMYKDNNSGWILFWIISILFILIAQRLLVFVTKKFLDSNMKTYVILKCLILIPLMLFFFYVVFNPEYVSSTVLFLNNIRYVGFLIGIPLLLYFGLIEKYLINLYSDENVIINARDFTINKLIFANSEEEFEENLAWFNDTVRKLHERINK